MPGGRRAVRLGRQPIREEPAMPKVSRESATVDDFGPVEDRHAEADGQTISFVTFRQEVDATPLLKGLPGDQCQCPHWGYVTRGRVWFRFDGREESYEAGDAFYAPPGHTQGSDADSEIVMFSPTHELQATEEAMARNMAAM